MKPGYAWLPDTHGVIWMATAPERLPGALPDPFDRLLMSQAMLRSVYLATLDQNIIRTFEAERSFYIFTDCAREG